MPVPGAPEEPADQLGKADFVIVEHLVRPIRVLGAQGGHRFLVQPRQGLTLGVHGDDDGEDVTREG